MDQFAWFGGGHTVQMAHHLEAPFTIDNWVTTGDASPESQPQLDGGPPMGSAKADKVYSGGLEAVAVVHLLTTQGDRGAGYVAQERIVGSLAGEAGTFVLQHGATAGPAGADPHQWAVVVPGSGTGALVGLSGSGHVDHGLLTLDYDLS